VTFLEKTRHYETSITAWILCAAIQSAAFIGLVWLAQVGMGISSAKPAILAAFAEFLTINLPLYLFMARSLRRWRVGESSSKMVWAVGSLMGGANLALLIHSLVTGGVLDERIEPLLLISTLIVTASALIVGVFILSNLFSSFSKLR
jgi:hypothetical protein